MMDPVVQEIILDKNSTANELGDILLEFDPETVDPIMQIIENEIGDDVDEVLDIFDWMGDASQNRQLLNSLAFQEEWWIIHKKLRRMIRKNEYDERIMQREQIQEEHLENSKGWQSLPVYIQNRLDDKPMDEKIAIAKAMNESLEGIPSKMKSKSSYNLSDFPEFLHRK
jgi:hypothetical protein